MKFNPVKMMLITSLIIILLYVFGLFLPILENTKNSKIDDFYKKGYAADEKTFLN